MQSNYGTGLPQDQTNSRMNGAGQPDFIKNFKVVDGNERSVQNVKFTFGNNEYRKVMGIHPADEHGAPTHNSGSGMFGG